MPELSTEELDELEAGRQEMLEAMRQKKDEVKLNAVRTQYHTPENAARVMRMQMDTGMDVNFIRRNLDELEKEQAKAGFDPKSYQRDSPVYASWTAENELHNDLTRDDRLPMQGFEASWDALMASRSEGVAQTEIGRVATDIRNQGGKGTPEQEAYLAELNKVKSPYAARTFFEKAGTETFKQLPIMEAIGAESIKQGVIYGTAAAATVAAAGLVPPLTAVPEELLTIPGAAGGFFRVGAVKGAYEKTYQLEGGQSYNELRQIRGVNGERLPEAMIAPASMAVGAVNAAAESIGFTQLTKRLPFVRDVTSSIGMKTIKNILQDQTLQRAILTYVKNHGEGLASEVFTEVIQESVGIATAEALKAVAEGKFEQMTWAEYGERIRDITIQTAYGAGLIAGVGPASQFVSEARAAQRAQQTKIAWDALGKTTADSKTNERVPAKFNEFVERVAENGPVKDVRIKKNEFITYFQSQGVDPQEVARTITGSDAAFDNADMEDGDILIPLAKYTEHLAATKHHAALTPNMRLRAKEMTLREAEAFNRDRDQHKADLRKDVPVSDWVPQIEEHITKQLIAAGTYSADEARKMAKLDTTIVINMAKMEGLDPLELYQQRFGGIIRADRPISSDVLFEQVINMRDVQLEKLRGAREAITTEERDLADELAGLGFMESRFGDEITLDDGTVLPAVDITDDVALEQRLQTMLLRSMMPRDIELVSGQGFVLGRGSGRTSTPASIIPQFRALQARRPVIEARQAELAARTAELDRRVDVVFSGRTFDDVYNQLVVNRPLQFFSETAIDKLFQEARGNSRSAIVAMTPNQFIAMAAPTTEPGGYREKLRNIEHALWADQAMDDVPFLFIDVHEGTGGELLAKVQAHEGRHRMHTLIAMGHGDRPTPVRVVSREPGHGEAAIRWNTDPRRPTRMVPEPDRVNRTQRPSMPFPKIVKQADFEKVFGPPQTLAGAPMTFDLPGIGIREFGLFETAIKASEVYAERAGIEIKPQLEYAPLDVARGEKIAREFDAMQHRPNDPEVLAAYHAMIAETAMQFEAIMETGLQVEFIPKGTDPYADNPRRAILDVVEKNHLWFFSTRDGFGTDQSFDPSDSPLLEDSGFTDIHGKPMLNNDVFRVVHDYFGHIKHGNGFRARGEENAWQSHAAMYSPLARRAMTVETRGQNSWVNFGPHAEHNRTASAADTIYSDQKIGLLPMWVSEEGRLSASRPKVARPSVQADQPITAPPVRADGRIELTHYSPTAGITRLDPGYYGRNRAGKERVGQGQANWLNRTYYGIAPGIQNGYRREAGLGRNSYTTSIDAELLYDYTADPENLTSRDARSNDVDKAIFEAGYSGYWVNHPVLGMCCAVFDPLLVENESIIYNQAALRSEIGLYSAVEQAVLDIKKIPAWNQTPVALTEAELARFNELYEKVRDAQDRARVDTFHENMPPDPMAEWLAAGRRTRNLTQLIEANPGDNILLPEKRELLEVSARYSELTKMREAALDDASAAVKAIETETDFGREYSVLADKHIAAQWSTLPAPGPTIWTYVLKGQGVRKEELKWLGLEEFLKMPGVNGKPQQFTRDEVLNFVRKNGVKVEEVKGFAGTFIDDEAVTWDEKVDEDSSNWEGRVDDYIYYFNKFNPLEGSDGTDIGWVFESKEWIDDHYELIIEELGIKDPNYDTGGQVEIPGIETFDSPAEILEYAHEHRKELGLDDVNDTLRELMREDFEQAAESSAQEEYTQNPYYTVTSGELPGYYITGSDDVGWQVSNVRGHIEEGIGSLEEAKIQAIQDARDNNDIEGAVSGDQNASELASYMPEEDRENFRILKLSWPDNPGEPFLRHHFVDPNVFSGITVRDKTIKISTGADGKKTYFILELQSDWATKGREHGYKGSADTTGWIATKGPGDLASGPVWEVRDASGSWILGVPIEFADTPEAAIDRAVSSERGPERNAVPDMPFKALPSGENLWLTVSLKRALIDAVESGYEQFGWSDANMVHERWRGEHDYLPQYNERMVSLVKKLTGITPKRVDDYGDEISFQYKYYAVQHDDGTWGWRYTLGEPDEKGQFELEVTNTNIRAARFATEKEALKEAKNHAEKGEKAGQWVIPITDALREKIKTQSFTLFQKGEETPGEIVRGSVMFDKATNQAIINLAKSADRSTFLHESGHVFLEMLGDIAARPGASQRSLDMYATTLKWLGVTNRSQIMVEHHEKFARGFEAYLMEGKSPIPEMQDCFTAFKKWLIQIYKQLNALDVKLNDDIRDVFDRMIASDEALEDARAAQKFKPIFTTKEEAGMSQATFDAYRRTLEKANQDEDQRLTAELLAIVNREERRWWKSERKRVKAEVSAVVNQMKGYVAYHALTRGKTPDGLTEVPKVKLDHGQLLRAYGADFLKVLPRNLYAKEGGTDLEVAAQTFGYPSADALVKDMARLKRAPIKQTIEIETDRKMAELYPDPMVDGTLGERAMAAIHNDHRASVLVAELKALRRKMAEVRPFLRAAETDRRQARREAETQVPGRDELPVIKAIAEEFIAEKPIRDIDPNTFLVAERKAARAAFNAMVKDDYAEAYAQKRKEILNHELYRAAKASILKSEQARKYLKRFDKGAVRRMVGRAGHGYLEQIDSILEKVDLRRRTLKAIDADKAKVELMAAFKSGQLMASQAMQMKLAGDARINWKELPFEEFMEIRDIVRQIEKQARAESIAIIEGERVVIQDVSSEIAASIIKNHKVLPVDVSSDRSGEALKGHLKNGVSVWQTSHSIARSLDQGDWGPLTRWLINPVRQAIATKLLPREKKASEDIVALYRKHYTNEELKALGTRIEIKAIGALTRADLLSLALNWGNEGSRLALLGGMVNGKQVYTEDAITDALSRLDSRDWAFVQDVWDYIDTYWADLAAAERRRRGNVPQKVEAAPFTIKAADGRTLTIKGGYYPLKYDPRYSTQQKLNDVEEYLKRMGNGQFVSASTRAGATHERVQNHGRVVRLGLGIIESHLREVIRDVAIGDEVIFVQKVLNNKAVVEAMRSTGNEERRQALNLWLQDATVGELPAYGFIEKLAAYTRVGFTKAKLALNLMTAVLQLTGILNTIAVVGAANYANGVGRFLSGPIDAHKFVMERSKFMHTRYTSHTWNKDVADTKNFLLNSFGPVPTQFKTTMDGLAAFYFWPIAKMQLMVDLGTWLGAYHDAKENQNLDDKEAAHYADAMTTKAQTSGIFSDRSGIERGTLSVRTRQTQIVRIWTTLVSYMLNKANVGYEKTEAFIKNPTGKGATKLALDLLLMYTAEGVLSAALYGMLPDDEDEEDDSFVLFATKRTVGSFMSGIPIVREIPGTQYQGGNTPLGALTTDIYQAWSQVEQGEVDETLIKELNNVGGTLFHYPANQMNRAIDSYWRDAVEEEEVPWWHYFAGDRNKE